MDAAETLRDALRGALKSLTDGDTAEAERRAKAISALVKAEQELAAFEAATSARSEDQNDDAFLNELHSRLDRLARAELADAPGDIFERIARGRAGE